MWKVSYILLDEEGKRLTEATREMPVLKTKISLMIKAYMLKVRKGVISKLTSNPSQTDAKTIKVFNSWVIMFV